MKQCLKCGAQMNDNCLFCTECGSPISQIIVCANCGASINEDDLFCQKCGKRIDNTTKAVVSTTNLVSKYKKSSSFSSQWLIIISAVLVLIIFVSAIICGVWYYQNRYIKMPSISVEATDSISEVIDSVIQPELYQDNQHANNYIEESDERSDYDQCEANNVSEKFNVDDEYHMEDNESSADRIYDVVEEMPQFPDGPSSLFEYLSKNIKYPVVAEENGVQGRVIVTFVVECDGSITDVKIVKSVDPSLDKEAQRVIKSMPHWIPGKQNGSVVRVKYTVPVTFRLQ